MPDKRLAGAIVMMVAGMGCGVASGQMMENFEHGDAGRYSATGGGSIQILADARYNGSLGARVLSPVDHSWLSRPETMTEAGRTYRTWVRLRGEEATASVGVDANHPDGPVRAVLARTPFGAHLRLETSSPFGTSWFPGSLLEAEVGRWYQLELEWKGTGRMAARLYDEGGRLLGQTGLVPRERFGSGPAAFRATGAGADFDDFRAVSCAGDCDGNGTLSFFDFLCFQTQYAAGSLGADCDGSGTLDFFDFLCFQQAFSEGCLALPVIGKHGGGPAPTSACGKSLSEFGFSGVPDGTDVSSVAGPVCGAIEFSKPLEKVTPGPAWGRPVLGDGYYVGIDGFPWSILSLSMPAGTTHFRMAINPIVAGDHEFTLVAVGKGGSVRTTTVLNELNPAESFSFCDEEGLLGVFVFGPHWYAVGEFAIRQDCPTVETLGTSAPLLAMCGGWMHNFAKDTRPVFTSVSDVPSPLGDNIHFSIPLQHRAVGFGWGSWSHGYTGDVYFTNGSRSVTITVPEGTPRFRFYAQPNPFESVSIRVTANGSVMASQTISGDAGAKGFGVCGPVHTVRVNTPLLGGLQDFAIGEFSIGE
jgi:hypothetical protein